MTATATRLATAAPSVAGPHDSDTRVPGPTCRPRPLARYRDGDGCERHVVSRRGAQGSVLVIDQDALSFSDRRLVAHLWPDEPQINASVIAHAYVADHHGRRARPLSDLDWETLPAGREPATEYELRRGDELRDEQGRSYRLAIVDDGRRGDELRWTRRRPRRRPEPVGLRTVIGALEAYEPARARTKAALDDDHNAATGRLAAELQRLEHGPFVLNRALREAVQQRVASGELSLSQIAAHCGRGKQLATGLRIGDTSWLGRRIGTLPETGRSSATPWIHSDTLALIAREGLGVEPREVELA
ncbi:MAG: hypothetical protein V7607_2506 [Solirubrobacteraceae bacterium]